VAEIHAGTFLYVDRPAGMHELGVRARKADAAFGAQGVTAPVELPLAAGETAYVRVDVNAPAGMIQAVLTQESAENGRRDMARLRQIAATPPTH
jgi:hypothetical protein